MFQHLMTSTTSKHQLQIPVVWILRSKTHLSGTVFLRGAPTHVGYIRTYLSTYFNIATALAKANMDFSVQV